tara:strand:- start:2679 stop:3257 length:579 start_codon:yes stop_codon:yes gene_type:complete
MMRQYENRSRQRFRGENKRRNTTTNTNERRNLNKLKVKEEFNIENTNFPMLNTNEIVENNTNIQDFKKLDFIEKEIKVEESKVKKGWLVLNKENLIEYKVKRQQMNSLSEDIENTNNNRIIFLKMIKNWENYREEDIEILGDRSKFIDTEKEINAMIEEENFIEKEINNYNEDKKKGRLMTEEEKEEMQDYY